MTRFGSQNLKAGATPKIDILDIGVVILFIMLTFLVGALWVVEPNVSSIPLIKSIGLNALMLALSIFVMGVYFYGLTSESLGNLKLVSPMWLLGGFLSLPIWIIYNVFLPFSSSVGQVITSNAGNVLATFFGDASFNFIQAVFVYGVIESLVFGVLLLFFLAITAKTKGSPLLWASFIIIVCFMALLHGAVALAVDTTGSLNFGDLIIHQIVAFAIMGVIFIFLGMSGNVAAHQMKNALASGAGVSPFLWILLIGFWVLLTFLALRQGGKAAQAQLNNALKGVGGMAV